MLHLFGVETVPQGRPPLLPSRVLVLGLTAVLALGLPSAKETKEDPRPKRGSLELGKGRPLQIDGARVDQLNGAITKVVEQMAGSVVSVNTLKRWSARDQAPNNSFLEFFGMPAPPAQPPQTPNRNEGERVPLGGGSGFVVSKQGYVFTNAHVLEGADFVDVITVNRRRFTAKIVGIDKKSDVAVLKIDPRGEDLTVATFGDARKVSIGEWVLAIGNPFALDNTVTAGIVSAKGRRAGQFAGGDTYQDFIQTDAAVNPGNSGGPLVNLKGEVIGINSMIYSRTGGYMGVSFAIPVNMAIKVAEDLIYEGKVIRGYLGIHIGDVESDLAETLGLPSNQGATVDDVMKNSPAEKGGLKSGDIILKVEKTLVQDAADLRNLVADLKPGEKHSFEVLRDGKRSVLTLKVGAKPDEGTAASVEGEEASEIEDEGTFSSRKLGIRFQAPDKELRERFDLPRDLKGLVLVDVAPGSSAAEQGLAEGMVLQSYKRAADQGFIAIDNPKKLLDVLKGLKGDERIAFKIWSKGKVNLKALRAE